MCGGLVPYCFLVIVWWVWIGVGAWFECCGFRGSRGLVWLVGFIWWLADLLVGLVVCFVLFLVYGIGFDVRCFRLVVAVM